MICSFCTGESRTKTSTSRATRVSSSSESCAISSPVTMRSTGSPTSRQIFRVTSALSPVRILTGTPAVVSSFSADSAESFGGSKKAM